MEEKDEELYKILNKIGISLYKEEKYEEALINFEEAIKINDSEDVLYFNKAGCENNLNLYNEAIKDYKKGLEINPKDVNHLFKLYNIYKIKGDFEKAIETLDKILKLEPENEIYMKEQKLIKEIENEACILEILMEEEEIIEAEKVCKKLLKESPQAHSIQMKYIQILFSNFKYSDIKLFIENEVCKENISTYDYFSYYLAFSLYSCFENEKAKKILSDIIEKKESKSSYIEKSDELLKTILYDESITEKGNILFNSGKYKELIELIDSSKVKNIQNNIFISNIYFTRAFCNIILDQKTEALNDCNEIIKINPNFPDVYMIRGIIFKKINLLDLSIKDEEKAKELDPSFIGLIEYEKQLGIFQTEETGETSKLSDNHLSENNNNLINKSNYNPYYEDVENNKKVNEKIKQEDNELIEKNNNLLNQIDPIQEEEDYEKEEEDYEELEKNKKVNEKVEKDDNQLIEKNNNILNQIDPIQEEDYEEEEYYEELEKYKKVNEKVEKDDNQLIEKNNNLMRKSNFNEGNEVLGNFIKDAPELKKFLNILPCALKSNEEKDIERYNPCLNEISINKIKICKENKLSTKEFEGKQNKSIIDDTDVSLGISMFNKGGKLNYHFNENNNYNESKSSIVIKRKLYSISINEEDISFRPFYKKKFQTISKSSSSIEEKAEQLEDIFKLYGFYVPLKFYIGGLFEINFENMSRRQRKEFLSSINANLKIKLVDLKKDFHRNVDFNSEIDYFTKSKIVIGGEMKDNYKEWIDTVNLENSDIIEYAEFRPIYNFFDEELEIQLEKPLELLKKKYKKRINYMKIIEELKKTKGDYYYDDKTDNFMIGKCDKNIPDIKLDERNFWEENRILSLGVVKKSFSKTYQDIIVGLEIKSLKDYNGKYSFKNPLLGTELNINFTSSRYHSMDYDINVYLMKSPE